MDLNRRADTNLRTVWSHVPRLPNWLAAYQLTATRMRRLEALCKGGRLNQPMRHEIVKQYARGLAAARMRGAGLQRVSTVKLEEDTYQIIQCAGNINRERRRAAQEARKRRKDSNRVLELSQLAGAVEIAGWNLADTSVPEAEQPAKQDTAAAPRTVKVKPERTATSLAEFYAIYDRQRTAERAAAEHFQATQDAAKRAAEFAWFDN